MYIDTVVACMHVHISICMYIIINKWLEGRVEGWMEGYMHGRTIIWVSYKDNK